MYRLWSWPDLSSTPALAAVSHFPLWLLSFNPLYFVHHTPVLVFPLFIKETTFFLPLYLIFSLPRNVIFRGLESFSFISFSTNICSGLPWSSCFKVTPLLVHHSLTAQLCFIYFRYMTIILICLWDCRYDSPY